MIDRLKRIALAQETLQITQEKAYINKNGERVMLSPKLDAALSQSRLYKADAFDEVFLQRDQKIKTAALRETIFEVTEETTLQAAERLAKQQARIFCLNFASAKNPGGGFLNGSQAQEESLARSSALYPCIVQMNAMYAGNKALKTCLYTDDMIYSPGVPVFRRDNGDLLDNPYALSILTSPAVNAGVVLQNERQNIGKIDPVMLLRLEKILSVAVVEEYPILLMGAWGCGVFRNDPEKVAEYFKQHLLENSVFKNHFEKIVFAVYSPSQPNKNMEALKKRF